MAKIIIKDLFANDATAKEQAGKVYVDYATGKKYKYVLVKDLNLVKGDSVTYASTDGNSVSKDRAGGSSTGFLAAGIAITTITKDQYGWIQTSGHNSYVKTDGNVVTGSRIIPHASSDGVVGIEANGSTVVVTSGIVFGQSLNTDTTTTTPNCKAVINCL